MIFPWKHMDDGQVWFGFMEGYRNTKLEEVTLIPTFGLHYMRAMREANLVKGMNRLGQYGQRLNPNGLRFWLESKYYGPSVARFKWRQRNGWSHVSQDVERSMSMAEYPS